MCVANIDNDAKGGGTAACTAMPSWFSTQTEKVVVGSFGGVLRIYWPRQAGYKIEDLLLEQHLEVLPAPSLFRFTNGLCFYLLRMRSSRLKRVASWLVHKGKPLPSFTLGGAAPALASRRLTPSLCQPRGVHG
jgi:hypothetical protein